MSPRSRTPRKISESPIIKGFKPYGGRLADKKPEAINLLLEEYEALRLCDHDNYNHEKAAEIMGVSRPTFTRIYASALGKIASAFVEGKRIIIEGGQVYFDSKWSQCNKCECKFSNPEGKQEKIVCPLCGSQDFSLLRESKEDEKTIVFRCDQCDITEEIIASEASNDQRCQICNTPMKTEKLSGCDLNDCL
jgi:predicted DNA-binding protein (UPF0251 family)